MLLFIMFQCHELLQAFAYLAHAGSITWLPFPHLMQQIDDIVSETSSDAASERSVSIHAPLSFLADIQIDLMLVHSLEWIAFDWLMPLKCLPKCHGSTPYVNFFIVVGFWYPQFGSLPVNCADKRLDHCAL